MPPKPHRQAAGSAAKGKFTLKNPSSDPTPLPNWPPLHPLVPTEDLSMEVLLKDQIIIIRNLFTATLCKNYVSFLSSLPLTTTPTKPKEGDALRVNDRLEIHDPAFAEQLWSSTALKHLVTGATRNDDEEEAVDDLPKNLEQLWGGESCGLNPRIRIYRYRKGQFFGQHYDSSSSLTLTHPTNNTLTPARTTWTLLIYLTGPSTGCVGGSTVFYPEPEPKRGPDPKRDLVENVAVGLEVGMALLHRHGHECMLHEGRPVVEGEKWVIRSDLCVRR